MKAQRKKESDLPVSFPEVSFQGQALVLNAMPFERWLELGKVLGQIEGAVQFWIGDYLNAGEKAYGEKYSQAVDAKEADRWKHYAWVARSVKSVYRKHHLSYKHHEVVAPLETAAEQTKWLDDAIKNNWSVSELRQRIRLFREPPPKLDWHETGEGLDVAPDPEPEFQEVADVRHSYYTETAEHVRADFAPAPPVDTASAFRHLFALVKALRTAEKGHDDATAVRLRTSLDIFIAQHERREEQEPE